jgi:ferredoxin
MSPPAPPGHSPLIRTDLLRWPILGPLLRWRHVRTAAQIVLLLVAGVIVLHGILGPQLAPRNFSTVLVWIHYRGLLLGALLAAGNVLCGACPLILVRDLGRRFHRPTRRWPRWLRGKWAALALFVFFLFGYELFDLWALPAATAWVVVGYFAAALIVDLTFSGAAFCKHVCPVGQFSFVASTLSPLEVSVRDTSACQTCTTIDCIRGTRDERQPDNILQRGCELGLFLPKKVGNLDCTFCLDCVQACPHGNVAIGFRVPGEELVHDGRRSAIGRLSRRPDLAVLALLFTFGALLNAFAMVEPVHAIESTLARAMGTTSETPVLAMMFAAALGAIPLALVGGAATVTRRLAASSLDVGQVIVRYAYALVPIGVGVWAAHYGFHFLTGLWTIVPVGQSAAIDATGSALLGEPSWRWIGMRPGAVFPLQVGAILLGALGSLVLVYRISERDHPGLTLRAAAAWAAVVVVLAVLAIWILSQPMEMRATDLGG